MKTIAFIHDLTNNGISIPHGEANGYVAVPPEHPLYGADTDKINEIGIDVHGGITFAGFIKKKGFFDIEFISDATEIPSDWCIFGFDTFHFGDNVKTWPKERVKKETLKLQEQIEKYINDGNEKM